MYLINKQLNNLEEIPQSSFKQGGFKERRHLQEWIAQNPDSLGEPFLVIQKEFAGFDDTKERIDLLAVDKNGNLVIIENKVDDSGKDVTWQALKYASYCSSLNANDLKRIFTEYLNRYEKGAKSEDKLEDFLGDDYEEKLKVGKQRIILVSGEFRKEVTSTVLWLLKFGLRIQCFKVTLYSPSDSKDRLLLDCKQIIPPPEAEDYMIKVAIKTAEESASGAELQNRYSVRLRYWSQFLKAINKFSDYCANINPSKENWIGTALGMSGIGMNFVVSRDYARVEVYINTGWMENGGRVRNKEIFDFFYASKNQIEKDFGNKLIWERMDDNITSRIKYQLDGVSVLKEADWDRMNEFMIDFGARMRKAFVEPVERLKANL